MTRYALRVGPAYPWPKYRGDVIHLGDSSREQVEDIRSQMVTGHFHEVVELDASGAVVPTTPENGPRSDADARGALSDTRRANGAQASA